MDCPYTLHSQQLELSDPLRLLSEETNDFLKEFMNSDSQKHLPNTFDWNSQQVGMNAFSSSSNNNSLLATICPGAIIPNQFMLEPPPSQYQDSRQVDSQLYGSESCSPDLFSPNLETESQQLSQLSVIDSQDENSMPAIAPWSGKYNFAFSLEKGATRKFSYSNARGKLFCQPNVDIEFLFTYDFEKCAGADMSLRGFLRYTNAESAATPVARCQNHLHDEREDLKKAGHNEELAHHVMKCTNVNNIQQLLASHYREQQTGRCYVRVPVGKLQPGVAAVSKMFRFDCLNSCRTDKILKKANMAVVFELLKNDQIVGRISFELRVCSCPGRDFAKEEPPENNGLPKMKKKKNKNCDGSTSNETVEVEVHPVSEKKLGRQGGANAHYTRDENDAFPTAAKKRRIEKTEPVIPLPESQDSVTSSQESIDESESQNTVAKKKKLRDYYKMSKFILSLCFSADEVPRFISEAFGRNVFDTYLLARKVVTSLEQSSATTSAGAKNPDSGVGPGQE